MLLKNASAELIDFCFIFFSSVLHRTIYNKILGEIMAWNFVVASLAYLHLSTMAYFGFRYFFIYLCGKYNYSFCHRSCL